MTRKFLVLCLAAAGAVCIAAQSTDLEAEGKSWWAHIQYLADDKLEGRNVGTPGFETAAKYVESQFQTIGLKPAGLDGFRQPVKLEARSLVPDASKITLVRDGQDTPLAIGQDASLSARGELDGSLDAQMVFVGYGLSIPEAGWDDFKDVDLHGKIAVYVNAFPPANVSDNVKSHVNTADERWLSLKHAGAIGVATIAAPRPAPTTTDAGAARGSAAGRGAGRSAGAAATSGAGSASAATAGAAPAAQPPARGGGAPQPTIALADRTLVDANGEVVSMTLTARGATAVLAGTGHTLEEINQLVIESKPLPHFAIPGTIKFQAQLKRDPVDSANIVGLVEGSDPVLKSEYVIMSAHLDHVGVGRAVNGDSIYNGAMDDASGVASVIETARLLKASGVKTKRSVIFIAVTAEEKGELGSQYFAARPTVPFDKIVADINLDMFLPLYALKVIEVQGLAESSLGESVRAAAKTLGVDVQTDREPEQNRFIRSDQYSFIRRGIPALAFKFGYEFGSPEETTRRNWVRDVYHKPNDDLKQPVNLAAAALFDRVIMTLLQRVANDPTRPTWNADSFFKRFAQKSPGASTDPSEAWPLARPEIQSFVRDAITNRLQAGDIPDLDLRIRRYPSLSIRSEIRNDHTRLSDDAVPHIAGFSISLRTTAELQAETDRTNDSPMFIIVNSAGIAADHGWIDLGTDILLPTSSRAGKLCCCVASGAFMRSATGWIFQSWSHYICS